MATAQQVVQVMEDPGYSRTKKTVLRSGAERWELWLRDGVLHIFEGPTWQSVVDQALAHITARTP